MKDSTHPFSRAISRPEGLLVGVFAGLILAGTVLLSLPIAHARESVNLLDALFTATSAVCVTGLVVRDTGQDFSLFGQIVILVLIQLGGLGIMTFAAFALQIIGQKMSYRSQAALHDMFYQQNAAAQFRKNLKWIVILTLTVEGIGVILLYFSLPSDIRQNQALYISLFHAISAFCNAGFSLFSDSMVHLRSNTPFITVIAVLIIVGGLGYTVLFELIRRSWNRLTHRRQSVTWSLNTRVVLTTSIFLIVMGAVIFKILDSARYPDGNWLSHYGNAIFQSITARTAGFNTVHIDRLTTATLLWLILLMFVGGSPGSCAGGIKTTSLAIWMARLGARLQHREDVTIEGRRIPVDLVRKTALLVGTAAVYNLAGIIILSITEMTDPTGGVRMEDIIFEQVSAFATVGLSTGLTPALSVLGKLWIILTMFVGRLGPLTIALLVIDRKPAVVRMPEERLMIG
ncbi:MAG: TrkH family potassium uptake protein [Planctomycetota bacterium]|jgi:trk system potassium uptake protein TrkH